MDGGGAVCDGGSTKEETGAIVVNNKLCDTARSKARPKLLLSDEEWFFIVDNGDGDGDGDIVVDAMG